MSSTSTIVHIDDRWTALAIALPAVIIRSWGSGEASLVMELMPSGPPAAVERAGIRSGVDGVDASDAAPPHPHHKAPDRYQSDQAGPRDRRRQKPGGREHQCAAVGPRDGEKGLTLVAAISADAKTLSVTQR